MSEQLPLQNTRLSYAMSLWGILLFSRPVIIDISYGQVNLFIVAVCLWAVFEHFESDKRSLKAIASWCLLTWVALSKLFPLPLLIIPWALTHGATSNKLKYERVGIFLGILLVFIPPLIVLGNSGFINLVLDWRDALVSRGLPRESHNQSFIAFIFHYLSGQPTQVLSEGGKPLLFGFTGLNVKQINLLSFSWTLISLGVLLGWLFSGNRQDHLKWTVILIGLLIVPSHLIWKPYFVMSIPLGIVFIYNLYKEIKFFNYLMGLLLFFAINLTGFDFVGHNWGAHIEAGSLLLFIHLFLMLIIASPWFSIGHKSI
jgi:hypothetical protein